ncbi:H/ACA ribonucleoprotein complex subunit 1 [Trichinella britovi]|uniref:H/ACA ribonucleoprotein complex subunit n=3 Tax=Trichinella TaxID=6333 RepID=A0A0V1DG66_TRIBR|nr:H/ACA ribonucleoprotein complex subunit 1 [Trichinella murrelli]KRX62952.1 H/ACA ribonucleoprotein complex subunit 1 [Trichinella sp. T9]KRY09392.1 H/ACA ribonucleoprotein complex subunit 1 [Trichinella patagoniensis]KRY60608.1 H/ACA ribonucleoprotein complex subunit 1 [Trichinella britovi]
MSFRSRGGFRGNRGNFRGGNRGRDRGGGFNRARSFDTGPPEFVVELAKFTHTCLDKIICKCTNEKIPYFNAPIYFENKQQIGKVDDVFGNVRGHCISVTLSDDIKASSFKEDDKVYIDPQKLLPLERFLPKPPGAAAPRGRGSAVGGRGGNRGDNRSRGRFGDNKGRGGFGNNQGKGGFGGGRGNWRENSNGTRGRGGGFDRGRGGFDRGRGGFSKGRGGSDWRNEGFKRTSFGGEPAVQNKKLKF